jgi:hypothetical protein
VPGTFAVIGRRSGWIIGGTPLRGRTGWASRLDEILPGTFVTKPNAGVYGRGIEVWTRADGSFFDHAGRGHSTGEFLEVLLHDLADDRIVIQERLESRPALVEMTGCTYLQTVRLPTLVDEAGRAEVLYGEWKPILGGNIVANIAVETGLLAPPSGFPTGRPRRPWRSAPHSCSSNCARSDGTSP